MLQVGLVLLGIIVGLMLVLLWATARASSVDREKDDREQEEMIKKYNAYAEKSQEGKPRRKIEHWQVIAIYLIIYDIITVNAAYLLALWVRFDCMYSHIPQEYLRTFLKAAPWYTAVCIVVFWCTRLYKSVWRFASYSELFRVCMATLITGLLNIAGVTLLYGRMPVSYFLFGITLQFIFTVGVRFSYRFILLERSRRQKNEDGIIRHRAMIIGAGAAGQTILREMIAARETDAKAYCIIDDNPNKTGRYIEGVPIVGGREDILLNARKYKIDQILLAMPSASAEERRDILNICKETGCSTANSISHFLQ